MAYTLGKKCAKNLCKRTVVLQFIIENVVTCFFSETVYITSDMYIQIKEFSLSVVMRGSAIETRN